MVKYPKFSLKVYLEAMNIIHKKKSECLHSFKASKLLMKNKVCSLYFFS